MANSTVVITGACGFLGSHLVEHYLKRGHRVIGVDNFSTGLRENRKVLLELESASENLQLFESDVTQGHPHWFRQSATQSCAVASWLKDLKLVLHFASPASPPHYQRLGLETLRVNSEGLDQCLQFADLHGARVIFASTSEVYGDPSVSPQPESYWGNVNSYGERACYDEAKRVAEAMCYAYLQQVSNEKSFIVNKYNARFKKK